MQAIGSLTLSYSPIMLPALTEVQLVVTATDPRTGAKVNGLPVMVAHQFSRPGAADGPWTPTSQHPDLR
jgi:hypothetical protein